MVIRIVDEFENKVYCMTDLVGSFAYASNSIAEGKDCVAEKALCALHQSPR